MPLSDAPESLRIALAERYTIRRVIGRGGIVLGITGSVVDSLGLAPFTTTAIAVTTAAAAFAGSWFGVRWLRRYQMRKRLDKIGGLMQRLVHLAAKLGGPTGPTDGAVRETHPLRSV